MNNKERIFFLTEKIRILEEKSADFQTKAFSLRTEREQLIANMILDDGMLAGTEWEIRLDGNSSAYLDFKDTPEENSLDAIEKLAKTDYQSWFELTDGVKLQFDDNDVTLTFKEAKQLMPFVKKYKLIVTGTGISDRLEKLKREVSALEDVCHQFNIT